ncbi:MAG TPA: PIN domain-containing protein [Polyangia bacterium]|jgi:Predicted nucleic acid-binding protein, contains PIN domain|nr:PIN domain-containing protein [Polyangia bacterium]
MVSETFVDTSGFHALLAERDEMHERAARILRQAEHRRATFVTTDYVLDETATLLVARGFGHLVDAFFQSTLRSKACVVEWTSHEVFARAATFMAKHIDQGWSFTDCVSFQAMRARRLREALTKDEHFEKAGFKALLRGGG